MNTRFRVPAARWIHLEEVKRSKFIAWLFPCPDQASFQKTLAEARTEHPQATHHCYGFLIGPPGSTAQIGMSDDGEPSGTAGKPILQVLKHCGLGNIGAIVIRYYGGTKLGTGGLVRAYALAVQNGLVDLPTHEQVERIDIQVKPGYPQLERLQKALAQFEAVVLKDAYSDTVCLTVSLPEDRLVEFKSFCEQFRIACD
ncbi:MAG: YigZ family protein [Acidobacteria bacterium]|nr:YigZ family protein [Acidobacteriota bacterium]